MRFDAVILAGSRGPQDALAHHAGVSDKALISFEGRPMLAHVIAAVRSAGAGRIAVSSNSAPVRALAQQCGAEVLDAAAGPSGSAAAALDHLGTPLLVATADHPLLQREWITQFLAACPAYADIAALLAERSVVEAAAPETRRTYLRFADGDWSGCNLFFCATPAARGAIDLWRSIEADRKRPWRIVRRLGPRMLLGYLTGRLALATAVRRLGALTGARAAIVASPFGEAAIDVDKPADIALVRDLLAARRTG
ncbi:NTP transferase domain-containing protein [Stakelama saccharophila]|uniref:NTP transferase domain-containing protein n=1 Tax=Stakelama saccharophila TaxID=3075605 RepID=A0ABZ0BCQ3_9SPHN|nr:NTP transferase domain-containing protein [Stakelama sp. W311]WNO54069.1 NTP transferase domain-containing protein [Stakelama sp. W311]